MAETILIPVAKQILGKAADLALEQIGLLWNFRRELRKLKDTVSTIQAVLRDAEEKQFHNHQVKLWLEKLSDVMYDADDLLDDLSTEARRKVIAEENNSSTPNTTCWSMVCFLFSSLPKQLLYDLSMAHAVRAIREKLDLISQDKETFNLEVRSEEVLPFRETDSCPPTIVVGRENDKKNIIQILLNFNSEANISVVPIVGMGGLGKTTLAQLVFDDGQVEAHFDIKVWVYVSQSFEIKVILRKMLRSVGWESQAGLELDELQSQLRGKIKGKRFLFVLDDVWEENIESWELLGKYLVVGAPGSKVLVTTRSTRVAEVGGNVVPYLLQGLSIDESWNLFVKKALNGKAPRNPAAEKTGRLILGKCGGVPLAIGTISGILRSKNPDFEWQLFLQDEFESTSKDENAIVSTLKLSFDHLPSHMKKCFTYCKLFPKGHKFDVPLLVQLWVSQGYVESEDTSLSCFRTLWRRSFFQDVEMDEFGNMSTCGMHDLIHDLADSVAGEKILRITSSSALKNIPSNTRHLAFFEEDRDGLREETDGGGDDALGNASRVRTLICCKSIWGEEWEQILLGFRCLRVLIMLEERSGSDATTQLHFVGKLKHLRYLGFNCYGMDRIPASVTNLPNLQVLKLKSSYSLKELPRDFKKLVSLKHLDFNPQYSESFITHMPKGIGVALDELQELNALRGKLIVKNLTKAEPSGAGINVLTEKLRLQSLVLDWSRDDDNHDNVDDAVPRATHDEEILEMLCPHPNLKKLMIRGSGYEGVKLCNWLSGLVYLVEFSLKDCKQCKYLPSLHLMPCLAKLIIENCPQLEGIVDNGGRGDNSVSSPHNSLTTEKEDDKWPRFPCLTYLYIKGCPKLTRLPTFPTVEVSWSCPELAWNH
ncbi:unnamed protein product [Linum tenue]|uniref:Disease resistance protein RGA3 n=1 Tax=Linum tenue TaxID=586396 RepID=A0AAV0L255_9ROSI|nr:unnamed protein product [Linum tenue]